MALTDEQIELLGSRLAGLYQELEQDVIADIARRVKKTGRYTETAEIMAKSLMEKGYSPVKIRSEVMRLLRADKEYQKAVAQNTLEYKQEITDKIQAIKKRARREGDQIVAEAGMMSYNNDLSLWEQAGRSLDKPTGFSQLVEAMQKSTAEELRNLTGSTGFKDMGFTAVENAYTHQMDLALIKLTSGAYSWQQVVDDCVHALAVSGLRQIDYKSGRSMQLDTAARLCVRTASARLAGQVTMLNMETTGEQLVEVSSHWGARSDGSGGHSDHAHWQGKVYALDHGSHSAERRRLGYQIQNLEDATGYPSDPAGLCGYNCRHTMYPFFEGVSEPNKWDPEPAPATVNGRVYTYYQATQKQRQMERDIRAIKREIEAKKAIGEDTDILRNRLKRQQNEYISFSESVGIRPKHERLRLRAGTSSLKRSADYLQINNWEKLSVDTIERLEKEISRIPERQQDLLEAAGVGIEVLSDGNSYYDPRNRTIYLLDKFEDFEGVHEAAHALEDVLDIWNDPKFHTLVDQIARSHPGEDIILDETTFVKPVLRISDERFISEYQGRVYPDFGKAVNGYVNPDALWDYFSEGYRCFLENPKLLLEKDPDLYAYIKEWSDG